MNYWRIGLELLGPYATPLTSGTLFGQLCWAMVRRDGNDTRLANRLAKLGEAPMLLSDVLPLGLLPRPLLPAAAFDHSKMADHKEQKKKAYVRRDHFLDHRTRLSAAAMAKGLESGPEDMEHRQAHNTIDRQRGTVIEPGGLFFMDEWWPKEEARLRELYVGTTWEIAEVVDLLSAVGEHGYGRDSSYGRGLFKVEEPKQEKQLFAHKGNRAVSLSHGCWTAGLREPRYRLTTLFGKLGSEATARGARPWKRPILLMRPGATFATDGTGPHGAWLTGIHQDDSTAGEGSDRLGYAVGHHAYHLTVPYTEAA